MPLDAGTKIGPYEIVSPLGAGGMGEVYRGRDARLGRDVAIKILPKELSADPVRKQRFEREARAISGLSHPNICTLHDVGSQDGVDYLVMECLEGETLAARLLKGALPLEPALKYGAQIAGALDRAHRSGVMHRDLKPGNIILTPGGAKLLDFGLAKPTSPLVDGATLTATQTTPVTQEGTLVGTFQYMSPEQVEGKDVDGRSDIFSLGAVLYEMVTGQRAFEGKSQLSVASAILEKEPEPVIAIKPMTPSALEHVIRKCLAKDLEERWQSAADVKHELSWISQSSGERSAGFARAPVHALRFKLAAVALGAIFLALAGVAAYLWMARPEPTGPVVRATLRLPSDVSLMTLGDQAGAPAISREGSNLVFAGIAQGKQMLFLLPLDGSPSKPISGTEGAKFPFWSSDGKSIGFFADQQLKRVDINGGPPMNLARAPDGRGGTWRGETILFAPYIYDAIYRVPASGGTPTPVTEVDRSKHSTHRWPHFLPDGKHFVYLAAHHMSGKQRNSGIYAGSIDGGSSRLIVPSNGSAFYSSGNLLFFRDGSLMAQEFEPERLELHGTAHQLAQVLREGGNWGVIASASDNGVLVFQGSGEVKYPVVWSDRSGRQTGVAPIPGEVQDLRLSPDRMRVAVVHAEGPGADVSIYDLNTGARTRLTFGDLAWFVAWSPDGSKVAYSTEKAGVNTSDDIYVQRTDGSGKRELLLSSGQVDHPTDWTRDGRYLIFNRGVVGSQQIWVLPLFGERKAYPLFHNATYDHMDGRVSFDGKWIAYTSTEAGPGEIYVTSFPDAVGKWQIGSGIVVPSALWRADGKELYFVTPDGKLMAASIKAAAGSITVEGVRPLFRSPFLTGLVHNIFDVDPKDGQRFIGSAAPDTSGLPLNVITNWPAELRKK